MSSQCLPEQIQPKQSSDRKSGLMSAIPSLQTLRAHRELPALTALVVALASTLVLTLASCASTNGIAPGARLVEPAAVGLADKAETASPAIDASWWQSFGDSSLNGLVDKALTGSPNLRVAQARITRAQAAIDNVAAADGLQVTGQFDATRQRFTETGLVPPPIGGTMQTTATLQAGASWEFDFFGRNRAALDAALGSQRAQEAELQAARVLLAANVSRNYVQLARLLEQRDVATRSLQQRDDILSLIRQRVQAGLDTTVELRQGEGALPETRQQVEALNEQIALTRHALAALTAQAPNALDALNPRLQPVQAVPLPANVPADLLGRRADISAARWRVEAATSDVKSARAQFYPNVSLTGFAGFSSIGLDNLLKSDSQQYGIGPAIRLPIFDGGRLRANLRVSEARQAIAVANYEKTIQSAFRDVADALAAGRWLAAQQAVAAGTLAAQAERARLSQLRFDSGAAPFLEVLDAQRDLLAARQLVVQLRRALLSSRVGLYAALGGGRPDPSGDVAGPAAPPLSPREAGNP